MATTKLNIIRDINGLPSYTLPQSNIVYADILSANVAQNIVAPTDAAKYMVRVSVSNGSDILISVTGTAAIPNGSATVLGTEINIAQTYVEAGGTVSVISPEDDVIYSLGFYAVE
jgi:hypothetical protein